MSANLHYINLYRTMILQIRRSVIRGGIVVNAKPIFILAIIESIRKGFLCPNEFPYSEPLFKVYKETWTKFYPNIPPTPICKPFYHLTHDGFWSIKWKNAISVTSSSDKILRENAEYGFLDNALWDLLQDEKVRQYYEEQIELYFLSVTK